MIITVAHQKGGTGKSTISTNLCGYLKTDLLDMDKQFSSASWNANRINNGKYEGVRTLTIKEQNCSVPYQTPVELANIWTGLVKAYKGNPNKHIVIDSPGFESNALVAAIWIADYVLTPVAPSQIEVYGLEAFEHVIEMAEKLGISRSSYTNYENGKRNPDYDVVGEICDILGCSMDELFGRGKTYVTNRNIMKENPTEYYSHVSKAEQPRLAIGVQNFRDLREKHAYYVDKTQFIEEFLESWYQITLITRPRRFGKTLNMSMLAEFLDCSKESADIFAETKIMGSNWSKEMNQHPVVFLSFLNVKADNPASLCAALRAMVRAEYERFYPAIHDGKM